jgi:hypothetical protein
MLIVDRSAIERGRPTEQRVGRAQSERPFVCDLDDPEVNVRTLDKAWQSSPAVHKPGCMPRFNSATMADNTGSVKDGSSMVS